MNTNREESFSPPRRSKGILLSYPKSQTPKRIESVDRHLYSYHNSPNYSEDEQNKIFSMPAVRRRQSVTYTNSPRTSAIKSMSFLMQDVVPNLTKSTLNGKNYRSLSDLPKEVSGQRSLDNLVRSNLTESSLNEKNYRSLSDLPKEDAAQRSSDNLVRSLYEKFPMKKCGKQQSRSNFQNHSGDSSFGNCEGLDSRPNEVERERHSMRASSQVRPRRTKRVQPEGTSTKSNSRYQHDKNESDWRNDITIEKALSLKLKGESMRLKGTPKKQRNDDSQDVESTNDVNGGQRTPYRTILSEKVPCFIICTPPDVTPKKPERQRDIVRLRQSLSGSMSENSIDSQPCRPKRYPSNHDIGAAREDNTDLKNILSTPPRLARCSTTGNMSFSPEKQYSTSSWSVATHDVPPHLTHVKRNGKRRGQANCVISLPHINFGDEHPMRRHEPAVAEMQLTKPNRYPSNDLPEFATSSKDMIEPIISVVKDNSNGDDNCTMFKPCNKFQHSTNLDFELTSSESDVGLGIEDMHENQSKITFRNWQLGADYFQTTPSGNNDAIADTDVDTQQTLTVDSCNKDLLSTRQQPPGQGEQFNIQPFYKNFQPIVASTTLSAELSILGGDDSLTDIFSCEGKIVSTQFKISRSLSLKQSIPSMINSPCEQSLLSCDVYTNTKVPSSPFVKSRQNECSVMISRPRSKSTDAIVDVGPMKEKVKRFPSVNTNSILPTSFIDISSAVLCPSIDT